MSVNISDLFTRKRPTINLPGNSSEVEQIRQEVVQQLDMGGKIIDRPTIEDKGSDEIKTGKVEELPEGVSLQDRVLGNAYSLLGEALKKAGATDPVSARKLIYQSISENNKLGKSLNEPGLDIKKAGDKVVKMRSYLFSDASDAIGAAIGFATDTIGRLITSDKRGRTNYKALMMLLNNPIMSDSILGGVGRIALGVTGADSYIDQEFDKSRQSPHLPDRVKLTDAQGLPTGSGHKQKDFNLKSIFYKDEEQPNKSKSWSSLASSVKSGDIKGVINGALDILNKNGDPAWPIIYNNLELSKAAKDRYICFDDPYSTVGESVKGIETIGGMQAWLKNAGYLSGYSDFGGFEIGSDHQWRIQIYPYPHEPSDVATFKNLGRSSITPGLPYYYLPGFWATSTLSNKGSTKDYSNPLSLNGKDREAESKHYVTLPLANANTEGTYYVIYPGSGWYGTLFSYSDYCPVLNYDLNFGTVKTETLRLFNGSQSEIFAGMNYNITMNMSILDDAYGSMSKYMQYYINCAYDVHSLGLAPYYACAFQINLIIFRSGYQVKNAFKLIGVPIEYTPRLSGTNDPNESRVDITFGIIGYIPPKAQTADGISNLVFNNKAFTEPVDNNIYTDPREITWQDIELRLGHTR